MGAWLNPNVAAGNAADLPWLELDGEDLLILVYWERTDIDDIDYIPEVSEDLVEWKSGEPFVVTTPGAVIGNRQEFETEGNVGSEAMRGFLRLKVAKKSSGEENNFGATPAGGPDFESF